MQGRLCLTTDFIGKHLQTQTARIHFGLCTSKNMGIVLMLGYYNIRCNFLYVTSKWCANRMGFTKLNDVQIGWEIKTRTVEEWKRALFSYYVVTRCKKKDSLLPIDKCLQRFLDICFKITVERLCFAIHIFRLVASNTREMIEVDIYFIPDSSREILLYVVWSLWAKPFKHVIYIRNCPVILSFVRLLFCC